MIEYTQLFISMDIKSPHSLRQINILLPFSLFLLISSSFSLSLPLTHHLHIYVTSQNSRMPRSTVKKLLLIIVVIKQWQLIRQILCAWLYYRFFCIALSHLFSRQSLTKQEILFFPLHGGNKLKFRVVTLNEKEELSCSCSESLHHLSQNTLST